jgi:hypothetical protein
MLQADRIAIAIVSCGVALGVIIVDVVAIVLAVDGFGVLW